MARSHTVVAGETLSGIAQQFYGDASLFPLIAAANGITDPDHIEVGQVLTIPDLPKPQPTLQPFFAQASQKLTTASGSAGGELGIVPAGKLLIVEDVTVGVGISHGRHMEFFIETFRPDLPSSDPNRKRLYSIPLVQRHEAATVDVLVGGRTVRWYIESGAHVAYLAVGPNGADGSVMLTVSGNFVDAP
jgi:LysM repeat protein